MTEREKGGGGEGNVELNVQCPSGAPIRDRNLKYSYDCITNEGADGIAASARVQCEAVKFALGRRAGRTIKRSPPSPAAVYTARGARKRASQDGDKLMEKRENYKDGQMKKRKGGRRAGARRA